MVRVRPPTPWEAARLPDPCYDVSIRGDGALSTPGKITNTSCLRNTAQSVDDRILTFDPDEKDKARAPGTKRYKDRRFMLDRVFGHEARQQEVYEATSQPLQRGLLDGFNATVFAYGVSSYFLKCYSVVYELPRPQGAKRRTQSVEQNQTQASST